VLSQQDWLDCYSAKPLKQQSIDRHVAPLGSKWYSQFVLASIVVDGGFETKDYRIDRNCFAYKHATVRSKIKYVLSRNQIICPSGATCLSMDCCFSGLAL
jgi:hypothetical protein